MQQQYQEQRWTNNSLPSFMNDKSIIASESLNFFYGLFVTKIRSVFHISMLPSHLDEVLTRPFA